MSNKHLAKDVEKDVYVTLAQNANGYYLLT